MKMEDEPLIVDGNSRSVVSDIGNVNDIDNVNDIGNNRMSGKNSRSVVSDIGNLNDIGNVNDIGNNRMSGKNSRSVVSDMGNVNTSPKYRTITNADLETIRVEMREDANRIAKDITLTNDDLSDLNEPETSLEI